MIRISLNLNAYCRSEALILIGEQC